MTDLVGLGLALVGFALVALDQAGEAFTKVEVTG